MQKALTYMLETFPNCDGETRGWWCSNDVDQASGTGRFSNLREPCGHVALSVESCHIEGLRKLVMMASELSEDGDEQASGLKLAPTQERRVSGNSPSFQRQVFSSFNRVELSWLFIKAEVQLRSTTEKKVARSLWLYNTLYVTAHKILMMVKCSSYPDKVCCELSCSD